MLRSLILGGVCLTILLLPWYVVRFKIFGIPTTLLEVAALVVIGLWAIGQLHQLFRVGLIRHTEYMAKMARRNWLLLVPIVLFLLAATLSVIFSDNLSSALGIYKAYVVEPILFALAIYSTVDKGRDCRLILASLFIAGLEVSLIAISQYVFAWPNFAPAELAQGRSSAMYNTANAIGLFMGPLVILSGALALGLWRRNKRIGASFSLIAIVGLSAIVLSRSDGALIAIIGSVVVATMLVLCKHWNWYNRRRWLQIVVSGLIVYVAITLTFIFWFNHPPQVDNPYTRPGFSTLTVRQCTWQGTVNLLSQQPILGSGLTGFSSEYVKHATCDAEPLVYPHNFVLNFWVETGIIGLLSVMSVLCVWLIIGGRLLYETGTRFWLGVGLVVAPTYWLIHGLVDVPYFKNDLAMLWWILFSLCLLANTKLKSQTNP